jgi:wyosine [tRNA(Phe)-imidazoG37] synthetase (radical SAM superfamily)
MANIITYNNNRKKEKIKNYRKILELLREPKTIAELATIERKRPSDYYLPIKTMMKEEFIIQVGNGHRQSAIYQSINFGYGEADLELMKQNKLQAQAKAREIMAKLPNSRIIRLEDYADRYAATQKMRTKPKIDARIGSTFSTMTF